MSNIIKACTMVATSVGYHGRYLKPGDEFEFPGGVKPSWAEPVGTRAKGSLKAAGDVTPKAKANAKYDAKMDRQNKAAAKAAAKAAVKAAEKERAEQRAREKADAEGAGALLTEIGS